MEIKPFLLRPDIPKGGNPRPLKEGESPDHLSEPLKTYAEEAGLIMRRPPLTSYTMFALEATEYAKEYGQEDPFHRGLYRAFWEDGLDLGDLDVIKGVTDHCGLDWPELKQRLESRHYEESVTNQFQEAVSMGVRGIPAFLIGNIMFTGARPYEVFQAVMGKVLEAPAAD